MATELEVLCDECRGLSQVFRFDSDLAVQIAWRAIYFCRNGHVGPVALSREMSPLHELVFACADKVQDWTRNGTIILSSIKVWDRKSTPRAPQLEWLPGFRLTSTRVDFRCSTRPLHSMARGSKSRAFANRWRELVDVEIAKPSNAKFAGLVRRG